MAVLESSRIVAALRGAFARDAGREELLRIAAEKIRGAGPPYTSVYLYMLHENELVLEAFAGRETDHTRIPAGGGVCGRSSPPGKTRRCPTSGRSRITWPATPGLVRSWWFSSAGES